MKKTLKFNGLFLHLDRDEFHPEDPGAGTPAVVSVFKAGREYTATFDCALEEGELTDSRGDVYKLSSAQTNWLDSKEDSIVMFLEEGR